MEISNLPDQVFKAVIIKVLTELRRVEEIHEKFSKGIENTEKNEAELKKTVTEMKNIPEGINSR